MGFALPRNLWPQREPDFNPPDVTPAWLVRAFKTAANMFMVVCIVVVWMRCLDVARENSVPLIITHAGWWVGNIHIWFPLFAPLVVAAIALPWTAKIIIPAFCTFSWRAPRQFWPKLWCAVLTVLLALVIMTAAFPLYHKAYNERFKDEATRLEQVDMGRAALQANLDSINADLKDITNPALTTYQAQAAREGAEAWAKRVATAKAQNDYQADAIERALAAAERGDQLRSDRAKAIQALAAAPTKAAAMDQVASGKSFSAQGMVDFLEEWWPFALFAVVELMALIAGWVAYMMEMVRTRQIADWEAVHSAPVPEAGIDTLAIEDQTDQWQVQPQDVQYDEYGNELVKVRRRKEEYYRRKSTPKKPKKDDPRAAQMFDGLSEGEQNPEHEGAQQIPATAEAELAEGGVSTGGPVDHGFGSDSRGEREYSSGQETEGGEELAFDSRDALESEHPEAGTESLTHAEEDQQAISSVSDEVGTAEFEPDEAAPSGDEWDRQLADERADEAARLMDADDRDEAELTETLLPNNEGVLVGTPIIPDDEAEALNEQLMARRAAAEAAE